MKHHIVLKFKKEFDRTPNPDNGFQIIAKITLYDPKNLYNPIKIDDIDSLEEVCFSSKYKPHHDSSCLSELPEGDYDPKIIPESLYEETIDEDDDTIKDCVLTFFKDNIDSIVVDEHDKRVLHLFLNEEYKLQRYDESKEKVSVFEIKGFVYERIDPWYHNNSMYKILEWYINDQKVKYERIREYNNKFLRDTPFPTHHIVMKTNKPIPKGYKFDPEIGAIEISFKNDDGEEETIGSIWENWMIIPELNDRSIIHYISSTIDKYEIWDDNDDYDESYIPLTDPDNLKRILGIKVYPRTEEVEYLKVDRIFQWDINDIDINEDIISEINESLPTTLVKISDWMYQLSNVFIKEEDGKLVKATDYFIVVSNDEAVAINLKDRSTYKVVLSNDTDKDLTELFKDEDEKVILERREKLLDFVYDYGESEFVLLSNDINNPSDLGDEQKFIVINEDGIYEVNEIFTVTVPPEEVDDTDFEEMFFKECMEPEYDYSGYNPENHCYSFFKIIEEV